MAHKYHSRKISSLLEDAKAQDVILIPLQERGSLADCMIIASGTSSRHIATMAEKVTLFFKKEQHRIPAVEGLQQCDWVLIDGGDIIIHLFKPEVRAFYKLEKLWNPALKNVEDAQKAAF